MGSFRRRVGRIPYRGRNVVGRTFSRALESLEQRLVLTGPTVIETDPGVNAVSVPLETDVAVLFDQAVAALSVTPNAIVAYAEFSGRLLIELGDITVDGDSATIELPRRLLPGEKVTVTVTSDVENAGGEASQAFQWEFRARAVGGTAEFEYTLPQGDFPSTRSIATGDLDGDGRLDFVAGASTLEGLRNEVWLNRGVAGYERRSLSGAIPLKHVSVADLEGDGDLDVIVIGYDTKHVWLNNGDATFVNGSTASWPRDVLSAQFFDFNGDGSVDGLFVVENRTVKIALNDGAGRFLTAQTVSNDFGEGNIAVADLDGDGDADLVGNLLSDFSAPETWLNNGNGTFIFGRELEGYRNTLSADVDSDGDIDLIINNRLYRNQGDGTFDEPTPIIGEDGRDGDAYSAHDFDGDGDLDLVFAPNTILYIASNDGAGNFSLSEQQLPSDVANMLAGDFDGDGDLDLAMDNYRSGLAILVNQSNITGIHAELEGPVSHEVGSPVTYLLHVENHGDQTLTGARVDFTPPLQLKNATWTAVASAGSSTTASGTGPIRVPAQLAPGGSVQYTLTGVLDGFAGAQVTLKATATPANGAVPGFDSAYLRSSTSWLTSIVEFPTGGTGYFQPSEVRLRDELSQETTGDVQFGDLDGDGDEDAVLAPHRAAGELWFNDGTGQFTRGTQAIGANAYGTVFLRDVNGDGDLDIYLPQNAGYNYVTRLWVNNGHGVFTRNDFSMPFLPLAFADINGDGLLDAYQREESNSLAEWLFGVSFSQFEPSGQLIPREAKLAGDLDGDGDLDMVMTQEAYYRHEDGTVVWFNSGQGYFSPGVSRADESRSMVSSYTDSQLGDVDGDGDLDYLFANARCHSCNPTEHIYSNQLWLNDGEGNFTLDERVLPARRSENFTLVDLDGDRDLDVFVMRDWGTRQYQVWLNDGTGGFAGVMQLSPEFSGTSRRFTDVDGDGDLDALFIGTNQVWINQVEFARVSVTSSNNVSSVVMGDDVTYTVVVANDGNITSTNLAVEQTLPEWLLNVSWTAVSRGGATAMLSGDGAISELIDLPAGGSVTYTITATIGFPTSAPLPDHVSTTVTLTPDANIFHPDVTGLSAGESDPLTLPFSGGGYLASVATDNLDDRLTVGALGDLDGDGDLDFVGGVNFMRVWINEGDGLFGDHREQYLVGAVLSSLTLVDLDGDGDLDILPSIFDNHNNGSVSPLENDGQGHFTRRSPEIRAARGIAAGDFDGDGDLDLMYALYEGGVEIQFQQAAWEFTRADWPLDYNGAQHVIPGDWDADGDLDVIVMHAAVPVVLANDGMGRFSEVARIGSDAKTFTVVAGDLNADGHLDLYLARLGGDEVWLNDGAGAFVKTEQSLGDADNVSAAIADLDGDGDLDVFALDEAWLNDGAGMFVAASFPMPKRDASFATIGDIDGDGDADVLSGVYIWRNYEDGADLAVTVTNDDDQLVFGGIATYTLTVANHSDQPLTGVPVTTTPLAMLALATWTSVGTPGTASTASGSGPIADSITLPAGGSVTYTLTGRVDGVIGQLFGVALQAELPAGLEFYDPIENNREVELDPIVASLISGGRGRFADSDQRFGADTNNVLPADLDGDGDVDFFEGSLTVPGRVWLNDGAGNFADSGQLLGAGGMRDAVLADLDGDLDLDLFLVIADAPDRVWLNDGAGLFTLIDVLVGDPESTGIAAAAGDFDGDGRIDVVVAESGDRLSRVWMGNGLGGFSSSREISDIKWLSDVAFFDSDNDGDLDLLFASLDSPRMQIRRNNGVGVLQGGRVFSNAKPTESLAIGDFNEDGWQDIVSHGPTGISIFRSNQGNHGYSQFVEMTGVHSVALGDVNGDGRADLVVGRGAESGPIANLIYYYHREQNYFELESAQQLGGSYTQSIALADFDGDGDLDIVFGNRGDGERDATSLWWNAVQLGDTAPFDGDVDLEDLNNVRNYFGATGPNAAAGDADGDGDVDLADLNAVRNYFGASSSAPTNVLNSPAPAPRIKPAALDALASDRVARSRPAASLDELQIWERVFEEIGRPTARRKAR
jgi:uncharacterized repeat protein (TIGR01451 family)